MPGPLALRFLIFPRRKTTFLFTNLKNSIFRNDIGYFPTANESIHFQDYG